MVSRTAYEQHRFSPLYLCFSILGMCIIYLYPVLALFFFEGIQLSLFLLNILTILILVI